MHVSSDIKFGKSFDPDQNADSASDTVADWIHLGGGLCSPSALVYSLFSITEWLLVKLLPD